MDRLLELLNSTGDNETTLYHAFLTLLSIDKRPLETTPALKTAYSYCIAYLSTRPNEDGILPADELIAGKIDPDIMAKNFMHEIEQSIVDLVLSDLVKDGLIETSMDQNGEFVFSLTRDGEKMAEEIAKENNL